MSPNRAQISITARLEYSTLVESEVLALTPACMEMIEALKEKVKKKSLLRNAVFKVVVNE